MSKSGEQFEKNLDNAKYDMYEALRTAIEVCERHAKEWDDLIPQRVWFLDMKRVIAKAEGRE